MTKLLVSVRNAAEAEAAIAAGADLIDVKEPARGSLGAADPSTIQQVLSTVGGRLPVSAALGELRDLRAEEAAKLPPALDFAKFGLAGLDQAADWASRWRRCLLALPPLVQGVAVVYADWTRAQAPGPHDILELACQAGCTAVLIDTFDKASGGLLDVWSPAELAKFVERSRSRERLIVLAGSLTEATIPKVLPLEPDFIAVRGAVCVNGRTGTVDAEKVRRLARLLQTHGGRHHDGTPVATSDRQSR